MFQKNKNYLRLDIIFLLILLVSNPNITMSKSVSDSNQSIIARIVLGEILSSLSLSIEKICVLEASLDGKDQLNKPLDLTYLDSRIITDNYTCGGQEPADHSKCRIMYMSDLRFAMRQIERPSGQSGEVYDRFIGYIDAGNLIVGAALDKCDADIHIYAFKIDLDGPQLIESAVIGSVKCSTK